MEIKQHTLENTWVKEEISREIKIYFEIISKWKHTYQNLSDAAKVKEIFSEYAYIRKEERYEIDNLIFYL